MEKSFSFAITRKNPIPQDKARGNATLITNETSATVKWNYDTGKGEGISGCNYKHAVAKVGCCKAVKATFRCSGRSDMSTFVISLLVRHYFNWYIFETEDRAQ